jgi:hypothetical protein
MPMGAHPSICNPGPCLTPRASRQVDHPLWRVVETDKSGFHLLSGSSLGTRQIRLSIILEI